MHIIALRPTTLFEVLAQSLWRCNTRALYLSKVRRWYSANSESFQRQVESSKDVENVAVIGGGITGLASAYFLSKASPRIRITLLEGGKRLGGWLHSEVVETSHGKVIFEKGPRTLRPNIPNGVLTLDLVGSTK
jgi:oxygen-dependent protoporphyrinogen oxidase